MKAIARRLRRLENQFGPTDGKPPLLLVLCPAGWGLALDYDTCMEILRESGALPIGPCGIVDLGKVPVGLNAEQTKRFLRENAAEICGLHSEARMATS